MDSPSIIEYFKGKTIFITGGSGFIGKALMEKLLRSCPGLEKIYVLIRPKRGKTIHERMQQITSSCLFDLLRTKSPEYTEKIIPIRGNTTLSDLGISEEDKQRLINEVDIFCHVAASVKFDDFLQDAILSNIRSAREAAKLALEMKQIKVFMHTSTTYCNIDNKKVVEPILYPQHGDWREAIMAAENCDPHILNILTQKYIGVFPNTYTYTKQLAEHCINDMLTGKVPTTIFRPSVVVSTLVEPFPGWIDNLNGPAGLMAAGGVGLMRTMYGDKDLVTDYVPVDNIVKMMIVIMWKKALSGNIGELEIYQGSKYDAVPYSLGYTNQLGKKICFVTPIEKKIWIPNVTITKCWYSFYIQVLLFHLLPAIILDILLKVAGRKPILLKIQRKIFIANMALSHFLLNGWEFVNTNTIALKDSIPEHEKEIFKFDRNPCNEQEYYEYYVNCTDQARQILLKEGKEISQKTRDMTLRLYYLDRACHWIFYAGMLWFAFYKINIPMLIWKTLVHD